MSLKQTIEAMDRLGIHLRDLSPSSVSRLAMQTGNENPWFTEENIQLAITGLTNYLSAEKLNQWISNYKITSFPKRIGIVMAGNIPAVGFHDLLCTLLSGHHAVVKLSSKDQVMMHYLIDKLLQLAPELTTRITIVEQLREIDAIIATGSDNTARYFHRYFAKYPNIIRKNRTSVAVLNGKETASDLKGLGKDIFSYFGLGCRNISKVYLPGEYNLPFLLDSFAGFGQVLQHHKYLNNYDYHKSIMLVNGEKHLDTGFLLFQENVLLVSPLSVLYYQYYDDLESVRNMLEDNNEKIQCAVSNGGWLEGSVAMGLAQMPDPWDYADGVDTMEFLGQLND